MSRTRRVLGWSRCPRHPDEGRTVSLTDDHEIEDECGACDDLPPYTEAEMNELYATLNAQRIDEAMS